MQFPPKWSLNGFWSLFPDGLVTLGGLLFEGLFPVVVRRRLWSGRRRACSFSMFVHRGGNCRRLISYTFLLLSNDNNLPVSFQCSLTSLCFCFSLVLLSQFFRFWPQNCESSFFDQKCSAPWSISGSLEACSSARCLDRTLANTVLSLHFVLAFQIFV